MNYCYILVCFDKSYYVGSTDNLSSRLKRHNIGKGADFTAKRRPCAIVWYQKFASKIQAVRKEIEVKKFSRFKKENLIFQERTIWQHYKGDKYIIIGVIHNSVIYAELKKWQAYGKKAKEKGSECQIYIRDKKQWIDWVEWKGKKVLRFNLTAAL